MRLVDADELLKQPLDQANYPSNYVKSAPTIEAIPKADYEALKQHLFELSYSVDSQSVQKDYESLRDTHYENQKWIKENGLQEEYYNYFFKQIKEIKDAIS